MGDLLDFVDKIVFCDNDEENEAVCRCLDCDQNLCAECDDVFHRSKQRSVHRRVQIHQPTVADYESGDEPSVSESEIIDLTQFGCTEKIFGGTIEGCMEMQKTTHPTLEVPLILHSLIRTLVLKGGLREEGIFRISIDKDSLDKCRTEFEATGSSVSCHSAHAAACLLKAWLRELSAPIVPEKFYEKAIECSRADERRAQAQVLGLWADLGVLQQRVLIYLAALAQQICKPNNTSHNRMKYHSLAIVFAPSLLRNTTQTGQQALEHVKMEIKFVELLFEYLPTRHLEYIFAADSARADAALTPNQRAGTTVLQESTNVKKKQAPLRMDMSPTFKLGETSKSKAQNQIVQGRQQIKVLVVGNSSCGKTSLIRRYVNDCFDEQYVTTVGADYKSKFISWKDGTDVQLQLWDIAGQDRYARMTRPYFQGAEGAVVVCDVSREVSIDHVKAWKADLDANLPDLPAILVANKCDLLKDGAAGMVVGGRLQTLCAELGFLSWHIISAKADMNVTEAMNNLVKGVMAKKGKENSKKMYRRNLVAKKGHKGLLKVESSAPRRRTSGAAGKKQSTSSKGGDSCVVS